MLVADGLGIAIRPHLAVEPAAGILAASFARQRESPFPEPFFEKYLIEASEVSHFVNAQAVQALFSDFAHAGNLAHIQRSQEVGLLPGHDPEHAVGLGLGGRHLRDQTRYADADRAVELRVRLHLLMECMGSAQRRAVQPFRPSHIEIGFVNGGHFDQRRKRSQHAVHFFRALAIAVRVTVDEDGVGAKFRRRTEWHGGVDAELAGLLRCRRNHAALVALRSNNNRLALQFRIEQFLHGHKEGVHVEVEDRPGKAIHVGKNEGPLDFTKGNGAMREPNYLRPSTRYKSDSVRPYSYT